MSWRSFQKIGGILLVYVCILSSVYAQKIDTNMWNTISSYYLHVKDEGAIESLNKSLVQGDIYYKTYSQSEYQITSTVRTSLDSVYKDLSSKCEGKLSKQDLSSVFAQTEPGKSLALFLKARNAFKKSNTPFSTHCLNVLSCELYDTLKKENEKLGGFGEETRHACISLVEKKYQQYAIVSKSIETFKNNNMGDDILLNGDTEDGPYDLLADTRAIADVLFAHNDPPAQIHFYNMKPLEDFVSNDPDQTTPYKIEVPDDTNPEASAERVALHKPSQVFFAKKANKVTKAFIPTSEKPLGLSDYRGLSSIKKPSGGTDQGTLKNALCFENQEPEREKKNILDLAKKEQKRSIEYNNKLDLSSNTSTALGGKGDEEYEASFGDHGNPLPSPRLTTIEVAQAIFSKEGLKGELLEKVEGKLTECVKKFTNEKNIDVNTMKKVVWKTLTQPTALTQCVFDTLCREVGDKSGRGLYHIKGCTLPAKMYGISSDQAIESVEEIVDEVSNICTNLQYTDTNEYNKTKDGRDHKMMRIKFSEKLSFNLNVGFRPVFNTVDPAHLKRIRRENNDYLQRSLLNITDDLTFKSERNRYVRLYKPEDRGINTSKQSFARNLVEKRASDDSENVQKRTIRSQKLFYADFLSVYADFADQNMQLWKDIAATTDSMRGSRGAEAR